MKRDAAKQLYEAGEISMLKLSQEEAELAKIQDELEQYFAEMSRVYAGLKAYCAIAKIDFFN